MVLDDDDKKLLELNCWIVECESPLEIRHSDGSFATLNAVEMILESLRQDAKWNELKRK